MPADIIITIEDGVGVVSGCTPKGQEWIEINCVHDVPTIEARHALYLSLVIERDTLSVEIVKS